VWFGEMLPAGAFERAELIAHRADVLIVAGTSALVYPAAALISIARSSGTFVVEVNPEETDASTLCDMAVRAKSGEFLPKVVTAIRSLRR
jgi:NAD-dependent deacetylase